MLDDKVADLLKQSAVLCLLKKLGSVTKYSRLEDNKKYNLLVFGISDTGRRNDKAQLSTVSGLLIGKL